MANVIKLKRGTSTPTTSDITSGEVALDTSAQKLYVNDSGTVKEIGGGGGLTSDAQENTVGGTNAGDSFDGTNATNNTLIGFNAGTAITTSDFNTAVGSNALAALTTGRFNTVLGDEAGKLIDTGTNNLCIGRRAGQSMTDNQFNVMVGDSANTTGSQNTFVGYAAGGSSASTNRSVHIGYGSGSVATGGDNVFVGYDCGNDNSSGTENLFGGRGAGSKVTSGAKNVILGHNAASTGTNNLTTGDNNILIGHDAAASAADVDNEITLGDANITKFRIPALSFSINASAVTNGAAFYENAKTVAADYTSSGSNAMAAGPITINSSVTVTISSGDTLTIV